MSAAPETVGEVVRRTAARLETDGLLTARLDAELIVAHVLGLTKHQLDRILQGDLAEFTDALATEARRRALEE